jgi:hypothetical protein
MGTGVGMLQGRAAAVLELVGGASELDEDRRSDEVGAPTVEAPPHAASRTAPRAAPIADVMLVGILRMLTRVHLRPCQGSPGGGGPRPSRWCP